MKFEKICVLGLGYIGLPTASTFATHGVQVTGVDINQKVVGILRSGDIHIHEPGLRTLVQAAFRSGTLQVSDTPEKADAFIIAVPTPIQEDKTADMRAVVSAAEAIIPFLEFGNLVVLESTSPPRTTVDLVRPILERSGLKAGEDFFLVYSAERVLPGQILQELIENARVIGGIDRASAEAGAELYGTFARGEILLTDATTAEMVKLMENTYRDINIAAANEFARLAHKFGINFWEARQLANLHPRVEVLKAGPGVGGHCISVDPWFLVEAAPDRTPLIRQARDINDSQPAFAAGLLEKELGSLAGKKVAALGLAYKPDVDDLRESPAIHFVELLVEADAKVKTYEPFKPDAAIPGAEAAASLEEALAEADALVLLVDHEQFRSLEPDQAAGQMTGKIVLDTRGVWDDRWEKAGFKLLTLGKGKGNG